MGRRNLFIDCYLAAAKFFCSIRFVRLWRWHTGAGWLLSAMLAGQAAAGSLEFDEYVERARTARSYGDWESAASQIAQAINHADLPRAGAVRSTVHLEYGRALGVLCQYDEAEKYLLRSKDMAEKSGSPPLASLYELGALSVAQKKYAESIGHFSQLLPMIEREPHVKSSPLVVADAYEKYAVALAATGKAEQADIRRRQAGKIRETRPKTPPPGTITPYGAQCPKS